MFDTLDGPALLAEMSAAQQAERVAIARRLFAAGRLCQRRMAEVDADERAQWCIDHWEAVAAEVGAELGISRGRASAQMNYGVELLERLPRLGAVFATGEVDFRVLAMAVFRTGLITDPEVLARIDGELSKRVRGWNRLSRKRLAGVIDMWVVQLDPAALRSARSAEEDRHVEFGEAHDGMVEFWGALRVADAAVLDHRLHELAADVASNDTRTKAQRRADALVALSAAGPSGDPAQVVIHVLAEAATLSGDSTTPGYLPGYGTVPPAMLAELAKRARLRPLSPAALLCTEPRYRPSAALADYIRCRDVTRVAPRRAERPDATRRRHGRRLPDDADAARRHGTRRDARRHGTRDDARGHGTGRYERPDSELNNPDVPASRTTLGRRRRDGATGRPIDAGEATIDVIRGRVRAMSVCDMVKRRRGGPAPR